MVTPGLNKLFLTLQNINKNQQIQIVQLMAKDTLNTTFSNKYNCLVYLEQQTL